MEKTLIKRFRILPDVGLGVSPSYKKSPKIGGYRGLIETINVKDAIPGNIFYRLVTRSRQRFHRAFTRS
jgi:hypothetical protein